jgi:hypothetical protein
MDRHRISITRISEHTVARGLAAFVVVAIGAVMLLTLFFGQNPILGTLSAAR